MARFDLKLLQDFLGTFLNIFQKVCKEFQTKY
jgi:hypothetical protein